MKGIKLQVPRQDPSRRPGLDIHPKGLKQWVDALPAANVNETVKQLLPVLKDINRCQIDLIHRHNFLLQIQPLILDLVKTIKKRYLNASFPLSMHTLTSVDTVRELHREMAFAYKLIIVELSHRGCEEEEQDVILKNALYCAIRHLSRILLESYIVYESEPPTIWSELHQLYQFTEKNPALFSREIKTGDNKWTNPIIDAYKRIVLLSLSNPYRLMQGETNRIDHHLKTWSTNTLIHKPGMKDSLVGKFIIDLATDAPPRCITSSMKSFRPIDVRIIDAHVLLANVKQQIEKLSEPLKSKGKKYITMLGRRQRRDMFVRLENAWNVRPERMSSRSMNLSKVIMTTGLSASHYFVSKEIPFNPEQHELELQKQKKAKPDINKSMEMLSAAEEVWQEQDRESRLSRGIEKPRVSRFDSGDGKNERNMWVNVYATEAHKLLDDEQHPEAQPNYSINLWHQRSDSSGGLSLYCNYGQSTQVNVGELVALKPIKMTDEGEWEIGLIRWLRIQHQNSVHVGIRMISDDAAPVATKGLKGVGAGSEYYRSLLLPNLDPREHPTTLITPAAVYDVDSTIVINLENNLIYAKLTRLVQSTKSFSQFQFDLTEAPEFIKEHVSSFRSERQFR
ncbi:MAG: hypothetical protein OEW89_09880 [Gammaproteobacteria bacterium]|nr:hypothetical protein [Gammaproteobacteria bacterium]MDH5593475.1 hypothetical protein [Gammaproteobacteria bacterium]MDH5613431.1 hypothetical protein [Gammaproteobacteria bacterium]